MVANGKITRCFDSNFNQAKGSDSRGQRRKRVAAAERVIDGIILFVWVVPRHLGTNNVILEESFRLGYTALAGLNTLQKCISKTIEQLN